MKQTAEQKLLPRMAVGYWDIKFQMERQAKRLEADYPRLSFIRPIPRKPYNTLTPKTDKDANEGSA